MVVVVAVRLHQVEIQAVQVEEVHMVVVVVVVALDLGPLEQEGRLYLVDQAEMAQQV